MAITFQKQPLKFFNVNVPAIFEFTSDADLGVNVNDLVADLELKSLYTNRRYLIKNILPNYGTGVFRVDISDYIKSLMLDNFDYEFNSTNKRFTIERFQIGVAVRPENSADVFGDEYVFDSGYVFDTTFIFAEGSANDNQIDTGFYPTVGLKSFTESLRPQKDLTKLTILSPKYTEFAKGFSNTLSVFVGELAPSANRLITVGGVNTTIPITLGVATAPISDAQINKMQLPAIISTSLNNPTFPVYGVSFKENDCEGIFQLRFYNSYGGYSYFYAEKQASTAARGKSDFINNAFYNENENISPQKQRTVDFKESLILSGNKIIELQDSFMDLLRSPKIEVLFNGVFRECEITGNFNLRKYDFEFSLNLDVSNSNQMGL